jgi:adenylate cyclase class IV
MPRNLELKARLDDPERATEALRRLEAVQAGEVFQVDTYFQVARGRMKLREETGTTAELIFYDRPNGGPSRWSDFSTTPVLDPATMKAVLTAALGIQGTTTKRRQVFLWNECRIHLDDVEGMDLFLEFEVMSAGDETDDHARLTSLVTVFGVDLNRAIPGSYVDLGRMDD